MRVEFIDHKIRVAGAATLEEAISAAQEAAHQHSFVLVGESMTGKQFDKETGWHTYYAFPYEPAGLG
jgi:hypothetical protein